MIQQSSVHITPVDSPVRRTTIRVLLILVALEPLAVLVILLAVGVPWWLVMAIFMAGAVLLASIFWLIHMLAWRPWQNRYPPREILEGAVSQSWQSFCLGKWARMNNCITVVADERHLHLDPFPPFRWVGAGRISLPLDRIGSIRPAMLSKSMLTGTIDGLEISGPRWCMSLAAPAEGDRT